MLASDPMAGRVQASRAFFLKCSLPMEDSNQAATCPRMQPIGCEIDFSPALPLLLLLLLELPW